MLCEMLRYKKNINAKKVNISTQLCQIVGIYILKDFNACENKGKICADFFIVCSDLYCRLRSNYQEGEGWDPFTGLAPPHLFACPKPRPGFPIPYIMVFLYVQWLKA